MANFLSHVVIRHLVCKVEEKFASLSLVATPIGNLSDFSKRACEAIEQADIVACEDTRRSRILFAHYNLNPKKIISYHAKNLTRMTPQLVDEMQNGLKVALVTDAGTPGISDPGALLVKMAVEAGIDITPIPGASAPVIALAASGFPTNRFIFDGFLPRKKGRKTLIESWKDEPRTIIFFESPHRIVKTLIDIQERLGERNVCVAREITKKYEEFLRGKTCDVITALEEKNSIKGEITVIIAPASFSIGL